MKITQVKLKDLVFAEYNPRNLTEDQAKHLKDSITRFGMVDPIIVNSNEDRKNIIIGGHQRARCAAALKIKTVPVYYIDLTYEKERELNVRLNKNTGEWDWDMLANHFDVEELTEWGFSEDEFLFPEPIPSEGLTDEDAVPEVEDATTKPGDMWILGDHRLLCGDATISTDVENLMDGQKAEICFTSPPYNVGSMEIDGNESTQKKYESFDDEGYDWYELIKSSILNMILHAEEVFYNIGMVQNNKVDLMRLPVTLSDIFKDIIYWNKDTAAPHIQPGVINNKVEMVICFGDDKRKFKNAQFSQGSYWNVISGANASGNDFAKIHKATFPLYFPENIITNFSNVGAGVIDCFLGTGTTLIACEKTGRKCYGMELDPHYCDVIVKRWEDFTGRKAELG